MDIKLKTLEIENFKGIKKLAVNFGDITKISGQNAAGKTSIFDAFTWLLFNKNSADSEKFQVRPLDSEGKQIDNIEISVAATMEIDGRENIIKKTQKQNWVKKRGSEAPKLSGNVNEYEVNGYPKTEKDYKQFIADIIDSNLFKLITNPTHFSSLKWQEQREIIMKFVTEISDMELARSNSEYADLIFDIENAPSLDDIKAKYTKAMNGFNKKLDEIPVRIDELEKTKVDVDVAELELAKKEVERKIKELDSKSANNAVADLEQQLFELQFEINSIKQRENDKILKDRRELENAAYKLASDILLVNNEIANIDSNINYSQQNIARYKTEKEELGKQYLAKRAEEFTQKFFFDESLYQVSDSDTHCPTCGREYPQETIEVRKQDIKERRDRDYQLAKEKFDKAEKKFNDDKNEELKRISDLGFKAKDSITAEENKLEANEKILAELQSKHNSLSTEKEKIEKKSAEMPTEADLSNNAEYNTLMDKMTDLTTQIAKEQALRNDVSAMQEELKNLKADLDNINIEIAKANNNTAVDERIEELQEEQRQTAQKKANQERMLYILEQFIKEKMNRVSNIINNKFKLVNFKLFDIQINGGLKETCELTVGGVPFNSLNNGHRIVAGLDIINSLSELYEVSAPIFIDNAESVNDYNLPEMGTQLVLLSVSDDEKLKVGV